MICLFGCRFSRREWVQAAQLTQTAHVVGEVLHADLGLNPHQTDGSHNGAAHVIGLRAKDMLDPDPCGGFGPVALLGLLGQRLASLALAVNVASQLSGFERCLDLGRATGGIGENGGAKLGHGSGGIVLLRAA